MNPMETAHYDPIDWRVHPDEDPPVAAILSLDPDSLWAAENANPNHDERGRFAVAEARASHAEAKAKFDRGEISGEQYTAARRDFGDALRASAPRDRDAGSRDRDAVRVQLDRLPASVVLEGEAKDVGPVMVHGMSRPERMRGVTLDGTSVKWGEGHGVASTLKALVAFDIPAPLWSATKEVVLSEQKNSQDPVWEEQYGIKNFKSMATGGSGVICVYNTPMKAGQIVHEMGHNLAERVWGSAYPNITSQYGRAQAAEPAVSEYAKVNRAEDFAEACRLYVEDRAGLAKSHPLKHAALEGMLS